MIKAENFALILTIFILTLTALGTPGALAQEKGQITDYPRRVIWDFQDPKDDDKGPGYYEYPLLGAFNDGAFDLRRFRVIEEGRFIELEFTFEGDIARQWVEGSERWTGDNGWILQTIDIYIDKDHRAGSGITRSLPGRNVNFLLDSGWENMILVSPIARETVISAIKNKTEDLEFMAMEPKIIVPSFFTVKRYQIVTRIDRKILGDPQPWWGWQVLVLSNDDRVTSDSFYNRDVISFKTNYKFGGGSDYNGDPNVLDLLAPDKDTQYSWLKNYKSHPDARKNRYPVIEHIYLQSPPAEQNFDIPRKDYLKIFADMAAGAQGSAGSTAAPGSIAAKPPQMEFKPMEKQNLRESSEDTAPRWQEEERPGQQSVQQTAPFRQPQATQSPDPSQSTAQVVSQPREQAKAQTAQKDPQRDECHLRMRQILEAARDYHAKNPQDQNITLLDLIYGGYFKENISCPAGGKYAIYGEETGKLKVRCFNPSGVEHGFVE